MQLLWLPPRAGVDGLKYPPILGPEQYRAMHGRLRRRMLDDEWADDAADAITVRYGIARAELMDVIDTSWNLARDTWESISGLYYQDPVISHSDATPAEIEEISAILTEADWRGTMEAAQPQIVAIREAFVRVEVEADGDADPGISLTVHTADLVPAVLTRPGKAREPVALAVWIKRELEDPKTGDRKAHWLLESWDIRNPAAPVYRVTLPPNKGAKTFAAIVSGKNVTPAMDTAYPWIADGVPFIPGVVYHAKKKGADFFDPYYGSSLVVAGLEAAVRMSGINHAFQEASYKVRNAVDLDPVGAVTTNPDEPGVGRVLTMVNTITQWRSKTGTAGQLHQYDAPTEPDKLLRTSLDLGSIATSNWGMSLTDLRRTSDNPQSGEAKAMQEAALQQQNAKFSPAFAVGDIALVGTVARCARIWRGYTGPLDGWAVTHQGLPKSDSTKKLELDQLLAEGKAGIVSKVDLYAVRKGVTEEAARERLRQIRQDNEEFGPVDPTGGAPMIAEPVDVATPGQTEAGITPGKKKIQDQALNGAQTIAMFDGIARAAAGTLPRQSVVEGIAFAFQTEAAEAEKIVGIAGTPQFVPTIEPTKGSNNDRSRDQGSGGSESSGGGSGSGGSGEGSGSDEGRGS